MPTAVGCVSIVVPTHDTRDLTLACLTTLDDQSGVAEVIVVDDASSDDTAEAIAKSFQSVRVLRQAHRVGFTVGVNRGLAASSSEILVILNSDTRMLPGSLQAVVSRLAGDPNVGVAGALLEYPNGKPQWSGGREPDLLWLFAMASGLPALLSRVPGWRRAPSVTGAAAGIRQVDWVTGAALAMRREVWAQVGPLDESFRLYCQDLDLCLRARDAGWKVEILPRFRVVHHHGATIRRGPYAVEHQDPVLLWTDLVRWARKRHGETWARRAALALRVGGRLRLLGRKLRGWFLPARVQPGWRHDSLAYRDAVAAVSHGTTEPERAQRKTSDR